LHVAGELRVRESGRVAATQSQHVGGGKGDHVQESRAVECARL
jgi:hypothetical protein